MARRRMERRRPELRRLTGAARRPRSDEPGEQLVREQPAAGGQDDPVVVRDRQQLRRPGPSRSGRRAAARRPPRAARPLSSRRARIIASAASPAGSASVGPARRQRAGLERREIAVEPGRVPAPGDAVEGVRARAHRLVRPAQPVGEVVPALVAGLRPVADLVAAVAGRAQRDDRVVVLRGRPILVLPGRTPSRQRRAPFVTGRWSPIGPVRPSASGSSRVRAYSEQVIGRRARGRGPASSSRSPGRCPGCRRAGRG